VYCKSISCISKTLIEKTLFFVSFVKWQTIESSPCGEPNEGEAVTFSQLVGLTPVIFPTLDLPPKSLVYHTNIYVFSCFASNITSHSQSINWFFSCVTHLQNLIDLAGSESSRAETTGLRRKEGSYINKSLLTLGTVKLTNNLHDIGSCSSHITKHAPI
jgi:hypothetical protein